jgi:3-hydroxymyristoyl/3-hydroxydecanoyl-(acyl carrier protein) dehydratase
MEARAEQKVLLSQRAVTRFLPHRGRALLIRKGIKLNGGEPGGQAELLVTQSMCQGHFPGHPILPGHILSEAAAQLMGVVAGHYFGVKGLWTLRGWDCKFRHDGTPPGQSIILVVREVHPPFAKGGLEVMVGSVHAHNAVGKTIAEITGIKVVKASTQTAPTPMG